MLLQPRSTSLFSLMFLVAFLRPVVSIQVPALAFQLVSAGREQVLAAGAATVAIAYDTITKHATGAAEKLVTLGATTAATVRNNVNIYVPEAIEKMRDAGAATFETVARNGPEAAGKTASWIMEHPGLAALGAVGTGGLAIAAAPALVTVPILSTVGFGAGGVQAGSIAALTHASIGKVVASSAFSIAQSAGAGGAGLATVNAVGQVVGGTMAGGAAVAGWAKSKL